MLRYKSAAVVIGLTLVLSACDLLVSAEERVARASASMEQGDYRTAMIELKNAVEDEPSNSNARLLLAEVSLHLGDAQSAEKELRRAIENGAPLSHYADLAARTQLALGQPAELLSRIDSGELSFEEPARSTYRGRALLALRKREEALQAFVDALNVDPAAPGAMIGLAEAQAGLGNTEEAISALHQLLEREPRNLQAKMALANTFASQGRLAEARVALEEARQSRRELTFREQVTLLATLTECYLASGDVEGARNAHADLVLLAEEAPIAQLLGARIAMAGQDYPTASSQLQTLLVSMPELTSGRFLLGAALLAQGNLYQAESHLSRVVQKSPENLEARKLLAQVRLRLEQPDAAMQVLLPAQEAAQSDPAVVAMMGLAQLQLGNPLAAVELVERSAAKDPGNRDAQLNLARTYLGASQYDKAAKVLRDLSHDEADPRREAMLVAALSAGKGVPVARTQVERLLVSYPASVGMLNVASAFYAQQEEYERARLLIGRALEIDPQNAATVLNSARLELAAGNPSDAAARLERLAVAKPDDSVSRMALAELAIRANDLPTAAHWLEQVRTKQARAVEPRLGLLRVYLADKRVDRAKAIVQELDTLSLRRPDVQNAIGLLYLDAGRYDEAGSRFRAALDSDSQNASYWLNLARVQLATDQRTLARKSLERAQAVEPSSLAVTGALLMLDLREGKRDLAMKKLAQLRMQRPTDLGVSVLEGDLYMTVKEYDAAARSYEQALERQPTAAIALKAYRARRVGKLADFAKPLETWVARQPDDFAMQAVLAEAYQLSGQRSRAIQKYELISANGPSSAAVLNNLAWLYYETGDRRAEVTAERAYRLAPANPLVADTYGWILVERGQVSEGLSVLQRAAKAGVDNPDIVYHYAAALVKAGQQNEAHTVLKQLIAKGQDFGSRPQAEQLLSALASE